MHCIILTNSKHWNLKVIKREKNVGAFFGFESEDGENSDKIKNEKKVLFSVHMDMGEERVHCQPMTSWPGKKHPSSFSNLYSIFFFILSWILNIFVWFILCYYWRIHWEQFGMYGVLGGVWFVFSNNYFQFLNNISRISTYFFTHTYFHKYFQTTIFSF